SVVRCAGCPNAARPESLNRQQPVLRPARGAWQASLPVLTKFGRESSVLKGGLVPWGGAGPGLATRRFALRRGLTVPAVPVAGREKGAAKALELATFRATCVAMVCGLVVLAGIARAEPVAVPVVTDVRLAGDEKETRFVLDLSRKVDIRAFTLA